MDFFKKKLELRLYQEKILEKVSKSNCLVVLPTGLGKTFIGLSLSALMLKKFPNDFVLFLAPTKPLVEQHKKVFIEFLDFEDKIISVSGNTAPCERKKQYGNAKIIFATPQTIQNDLILKRINLKDCCLIVYDECHRAVGDYAYVFISQVHAAQRGNIRVLGLSASPGSDKGKILEVCKNLFLDDVVYKGESDPDVLPYINKKDVEVIELRLPDELENIKKMLETALKKRLSVMKARGLINTSDINKIGKKTFLAINADISKKLKDSKDPELFKFISLNSEIIKLLYCLELLQTQGVKPLVSYFSKLKSNLKIKSNSSLFQDEDFRQAVLCAFDVEEKIEHPKFAKIKDIIDSGCEKDSRFIVFTQYRETAKRIVESLEDFAKPVLFIGQAGKQGLSQKKQLAVIEDFESGKFNVLVATSVAEEGLHIPSADCAIFFEPVPSGLRMIQRKGRVGRVKIGRIIVLYTKGCIDEKYLFVGRAKEKKMKFAISDAKDALIAGRQKKLGDF
ncbi:MAG: DEAD/DEAH box helicase family protein [Candidatus Nanoarchaeia archaeon]|nr:DEAD/DEAH box helicase family protein [Candidatus Nanoarchaeia archaeon]MDD5053932.1 DEAD/DEAH box helicase family protein [Candidatus Nanoarchaeia archaeon]